MNEKNLKTLVRMSNQMNDEDHQLAVNRAKVSNPSKEVESSLVGFLTARMNKLTEDAEFENLLKDNIRQRLPEASFSELTQLMQVVGENNSRAVEVTMPIFHNEKEGKSIMEELKDNSAQTAAVNIYNNTDDAKVLQSLTYLSQIADMIKNQAVTPANVTDAVVEESK